jgi:hypothetical protein
VDIKSVSYYLPWVESMAGPKQGRSSMHRTRQSTTPSSRYRPGVGRLCQEWRPHACKHCVRIGRLCAKFVRDEERGFKIGLCPLPEEHRVGYTVGELRFWVREA